MNSMEQKELRERLNTLDIVDKNNFLDMLDKEISQNMLFGSPQTMGLLIARDIFISIYGERQ